MMTEAETGVMQLQAKACQGFHHQKLGTVKEGLFLRAVRGSMALPTLRFQTSSLQNCERINKFLSHPVCGTLCHRKPRKVTQRYEYIYIIVYVFKTK